MYLIFKLTYYFLDYLKYRNNQDLGKFNHDQFTNVSKSYAKGEQPLTIKLWVAIFYKPQDPTIYTIIFSVKYIILLQSRNQVNIFYNNIKLNTWR